MWTVLVDLLIQLQLELARVKMFSFHAPWQIKKNSKLFTIFDYGKLRQFSKSKEQFIWKKGYQENSYPENSHPDNSHPSKSPLENSHRENSHLEYSHPCFLTFPLEFLNFLFFHYCHLHYWYYLKDCLVILCFKSADVRNPGIDVSKKL